MKKLLIILILLLSVTLFLSCGEEPAYTYNTECVEIVEEACKEKNMTEEDIKENVFFNCASLRED